MWCGARALAQASFTENNKSIKNTILQNGRPADRHM